MMFIGTGDVKWEGATQQTYSPLPNRRVSPKNKKG